MIETLISFCYIAAAVAFILALKWLSAVPTARKVAISCSTCSRAPGSVIASQIDVPMTA